MANSPNDIPVDYALSRYDPENSYDDNNTSFTLASTIHDFSYEHGRRYPSYRAGPSPFPLDELSVRNEKILHHMMLYLLDDRLFVTPVQNPKSILDVRCAQGAWAENMADQFPDAEVVAMDTTPRERSTCPNVTFLVQSFNDEWILDRPDMKFDFIFARNLFAASSDFAHFYKQAFDNTAPGGHFEHAEILIDPLCDDDSAEPDSTIQKMANMTREMTLSSGMEYNIAHKMTRLIQETGFVDITETRYKCPLGSWSADPKYKQVGEWFEAFFKSGLQGWTIGVMTRNMGVNELCEEAFKEIDERKQHYYFQAIIVHARKPA